MNKNLRKAMISAVCMLIVGVMSLTGVTYAWFTAAKTASVNGVNVTIVSADGGIELDKGDGDWKFTLDAVDQNADVQNKLPVSASKTLNNADKLSFFTGTVPEDAENSNMITTAKDEKNFFYTEFRMRNANKTDATVTLTGRVNYTANPAVVNAARWAIVDLDTRDVYFFAGNTVDNVAGTNDYLAVIAESTTAFNCQDASTGKVEYVALNELGDFSITVNPVEYDAEGKEANLHARRFALYAWLEGNDPDCTNSLSGSAFEVILSFNTALAGADAE